MEGQQDIAENPSLITNKIYNMDCLEGMRRFPDKSIDLIITSPPYNMGYFGEETIREKYIDPASDKKEDCEYILWLDTVIAESLRISRYVFWNVQFIRPTRGHILSIQNKFKDNLKDIFIWKKPCAASINGRSGAMGHGWEYIFMFGENNLVTFPYNNFSDNNHVPNIQSWNAATPNKDHHATFPEILPDYFIRYFTKENDIVLDPFSGSGTTAIAAIMNGRRFIGFEKEKIYYDAANIRIKNAQEQGKISVWF